MVLSKYLLEEEGLAQNVIRDCLKIKAKPKECGFYYVN